MDTHTESTLFCDYCAKLFTCFAQYKSHQVRCPGYSAACAQSSASPQSGVFYLPKTYDDAVVPPINNPSINYFCCICKSRFLEFQTFLVHFWTDNKSPCFSNCIDPRKTELGPDDLCVCILCGFSESRVYIFDHILHHADSLTTNRLTNLEGVLYKWCPLCKPLTSVRHEFSSRIDFVYHLCTCHPSAYILAKRTMSNVESDLEDPSGSRSPCFFCGVTTYGEEKEHVCRKIGKGIKRKKGNDEKGSPSRPKKDRIRTAADQQPEDIDIISWETFHSLHLKQSTHVQDRMHFVKQTLTNQEIVRSIMTEHSSTPTVTISGQKTKDNKLWSTLVCCACSMKFKSDITLKQHKSIMHCKTGNELIAREQQTNALAHLHYAALYRKFIELFRSGVNLELVPIVRRTNEDPVLQSLISPNKTKSLEFQGLSISPGQSDDSKRRITVATTTFKKNSQNNFNINPIRTKYYKHFRCVASSTNLRRDTRPTLVDISRLNRTACQYEPTTQNNATTTYRGIKVMLRGQQQDPLDVPQTSASTRPYVTARPLTIRSAAMVPDRTFMLKKTNLTRDNIINSPIIKLSGLSVDQNGSLILKVPQSAVVKNPVLAKVPTDAESMHATRTTHQHSYYQCSKRGSDKESIVNAVASRKEPEIVDVLDT